MKKVIRITTKIIAVFIILIVVNCNKCFADVVVNSDIYTRPIFAPVALITGIIGIVILVIAIHFLSELQYLFDIKYDYVEKILFWLPIIMCIISDVVRKKSEKKSNIIFFISICFVCLNSITLYIKYN